MCHSLMRVSEKIQLGVVASETVVVNARAPAAAKFSPELDIARCISMPEVVRGSRARMCADSGV